MLEDILEQWLDELDRFTPDREPSDAIAEYVAGKLYWSRVRPNASKVFANEILHGAPFLKSYLARDLRQRVEQKAKVIRQWIRSGKLRPVDPKHFIFQLWASTQHYADFDVQVRAVLGRRKLGERDFAAATANIAALISRRLLDAWLIFLPFAERRGGVAVLRRRRGHKSQRRLPPMTPPPATRAPPRAPRREEAFASTSQIGATRDAFVPSDGELAYAARAIAAMEEAERNGQGAVTVSGQDGQLQDISGIIPAPDEF